MAMKAMYIPIIPGKRIIRLVANENTVQPAVTIFASTIFVNRKVGSAAGTDHNAVRNRSAGPAYDPCL
jgi:hypothetical protein